MATLTKQRPASTGVRSSVTSGAGRKRGGGHAVVNEVQYAARKSQPARDRRRGTDGPIAAGKSQSRSRIDSQSEYDVDGAAGVAARDTGRSVASRKNNGRANAETQPGSTVRGRGGNGEPCREIDEGFADSRPKQAADDRAIDNDIENVCRSLQSLQRRRVMHLKARIAIDNQLGSIVATELSFVEGNAERDRKELRAEAEKIIEEIDAGDDSAVETVRTAVSGIVLNTKIARNGMDGAGGFNGAIKAIEKEMESLAESLPVAKWVQSVPGFGLLNLAIIIGECGDLSSYANPAKVWRRMGCAPFKNKMGSTWKRKGGLSAEDWTEFGYSPRRRAIAFCLADCLIKNNGAREAKGERPGRECGPYRKRYDDVKAAKLALNDEAWPKLRCHLHASLLCAKMAMRDLWVEWNDGPAMAGTKPRSTQPVIGATKHAS